ncbi:MAG: HAMP domain-containing sensor histidine kinase [Salinibacter sp.]
MGGGPGLLRFRAYVDRRSRPVVQVEDNGPGIPTDVQEKIFVPFFTTKEDGSGIGLSLSRQIMHLHGGSLSVRSEEGEGAVFTLRF